MIHDTQGGSRWKPTPASKQAIFIALTPHSLRTHYLTYTFCFHFCAQTSRVSRRLGALCQATPSVQIAVNRAGRAWRALGKLPTQLEAALWPHPLNPSSALLRWQSLARSYCMAPCPGRSGRPEAWHHRSAPRNWQSLALQRNTQSSGRPRQPQSQLHRAERPKAKQEDVATRPRSPQRGLSKP